MPIAAAPKNPPHGEFALGQSPDGAALKFVHRGSYDDLDNTYEAITNYLDDKRLEAKEMIEEYVTDPLSADAGKLVVNVYVLIKPSDALQGKDRDYNSHTCPGRNARNSAGGIPAGLQGVGEGESGASIASSVSWNVP